jgi:hypothetical protein
MFRVLKPGPPMVILGSRRIMPDALLRLEGRHERIDWYWLAFEVERAGLTGVLAYPLLAGGPKDRRLSSAWDSREMWVVSASSRKPFKRAY